MLCVIPVLLISVFSSVNAYAYVNDTEVIRVTAPNMTGGGTFDFSSIPVDSTGNTTAYSDSGDPFKQETCNILRADRPSGCNMLGPPVISANGCSTVIKVAFYNSFFGSACNSHDTCYSSSGAVQIACDGIFHQQMELKCNTLDNDGEFVRCLSAASKYHTGVRNGGGAFFHLAQADRACVKWHDRMNKKGC